MKPDQWQHLIVEDWLGVTVDGLWASTTCGLAVPRQNGKNGALEIREVIGAAGLGEKILHTAHEVKTAKKHFRRMLSYFGQQPNDPKPLYPDLNALVVEVRRVNGQEAIILSNGGSIEFIARSKNSGRGFTVDVLVLDEAQEMDDDALEALLPTTSAAPLGNPQWIYCGTPPGPSASGQVFTRVREEALGDSPGAVTWHEWSPEPGYDRDDPNVWLRSNPALASGRLQLAVIKGERARFSPDGFDRERLGLWPEKAGHAPTFSAGEWSCLFDPFVPEGRTVLGVKFSIDGALVGVSAAVRPTDGPIAVSGIRLASTGEGLAWIVDLFERRRDEFVQVVIDGKAGAPALVQAFADAGVKLRSKLPGPSQLLRVPPLPDYLAAHTMFERAVRDGDLSQDGSATLALQVENARKRPIGTQGGYGWQGVMDTDDTTLLDSATLAYWGAKTTRRRPAGAGTGMVVL